MSRYQNTPVFASDFTLPRRYINVKYPEILREFSDIYVYATQGDRYDLLANTYYRNSSLWWIISLANAKITQNSLTPPRGAQIRIPANPISILAEFEEMNK